MVRFLEPSGIWCTEAEPEQVRDPLAGRQTSGKLPHCAAPSYLLQGGRREREFEILPNLRAGLFPKRKSKEEVVFVSPSPCPHVLL